MSDSTPGGSCEPAALEGLLSEERDDGRGGSGRERMEEDDFFFCAGGRRVEGYEPLASLMEGDREKVVVAEAAPLLRLLGRGGVAERVVGSELLGSRKELRFLRVGEAGRDTDEGGRSKAGLVSARCSYCFVMCLTERLCVSEAGGLPSCETSGARAVESFCGLDGGRGVETLALREGARTRSDAVESGAGAIVMSRGASCACGAVKRGEDEGIGSNGGVARRYLGRRGQSARQDQRLSSRGRRG